jgi:hypothetical protein
VDVFLSPSKELGLSNLFSCVTSRHLTSLTVIPQPTYTPKHNTNMVSKAALEAISQRAAEAANKKSYEAREILAKVSVRAHKKIVLTLESSNLFDQAHLDAIPKFSLGEVDLGRVLGKGGFGTVCEIRKITCKGDGAKATVGVSKLESFGDDDAIRDQEFQDKKFIADHAIRDGGDGRYAIKVHCVVFGLQILVSHAHHLFAYLCTIDRLSVPRSRVIPKPSHRVSSIWPWRQCSSP